VNGLTDGGARYNPVDDRMIVLPIYLNKSDFYGHYQLPRR
jgi:hypothetical protein